MSDRLAPLSSSPTPSRATDYQRRLPIGAEPISEGRTHVRVWAPRAREVRVVCRGAATPLTLERDGYHSGEIAAAAGDHYQFALDADEKLYPDPASRFQPEGPHGPSEIVDPRDLIDGLVRRRAVYMWRSFHHLKPTVSYYFALQKISGGGATWQRECAVGRVVDLEEN